MNHKSMIKTENQIPRDKYGVLHTEVMTGIITDPRGHRTAGPSQFLIFPSLEEALHYSNQKVVETPETVCNIFDCQKKQIETIKNEEYISSILNRAREKREKKPWWKLW